VDGAERRPAATALVGILVVAFGAVLSVPALYTYFGLAGPSRPLFVIVLFALTLWFATLSLDRVLGLDELRAIR
jgi:cation-transporting ATPase E